MKLVIKKYIKRKKKYKKYKKVTVQVWNLYKGIESKRNRKNIQTTKKK